MRFTSFVSYFLSELDRIYVQDSIVDLSFHAQSDQNYAFTARALLPDRNLNLEAWRAIGTDHKWTLKIYCSTTYPTSSIPVNRKVIWLNERQGLLEAWSILTEIRTGEAVFFQSVNELLASLKNKYGMGQ